MLKLIFSHFENSLTAKYKVLQRSTFSGSGQREALVEAKPGRTVFCFELDVRISRWVTIEKDTHWDHLKLQHHSQYSMTPDVYLG